MTDPMAPLCDALIALKNRAEAKAFLQDLCTPGEIRDFQERWLIARLLYEDKMSYREIAAKTGASTTTVARVSRFLRQEPHQGYRLVLERLAFKKKS